MAMKRRVFILFIVSVSFVSLSAQTSTQRSLINKFFERRDVKEVIQIIGHPTPKHNGVTISYVSDNSVYLKAFYDDFWVGSFSCDYRLGINSSGNFTGVYSTACHCPTVDCFDAQNFSRIMNYLDENGEALTSNHPAVKIQEQMRGKTLDRFSAREILCCALFTIWYDNDYYTAY
jgi:hypothetical protein